MRVTDQYSRFIHPVLFPNNERKIWRPVRFLVDDSFLRGAVRWETNNRLTIELLGARAPTITAFKFKYNALHLLESRKISQEGYDAALSSTDQAPEVQLADEPFFERNDFYKSLLLFNKEQT